MEAILKYNLKDPDDRKSHVRATKSCDMAAALFEITKNLKRTLKHRFESQSQKRDEFEVLDEVFLEIGELLEAFDINIDELID